MGFSKFAVMFLLLAAIGQTASWTTCAAQARNERDAGISTAGQAPLLIPLPPEKPKKPANAACGNPAKPCRHKQKYFDDWELSFQMPARLIPNKVYSSAPFYAVILKTYTEGCEEFDSNSAIEPERIKLQKSFPTRKIFANYSCPNMSAVNYDFAGRLDKKGERDLFPDYLAVYGGNSEIEAKALLDGLRSQFPKAFVKKMTANFSVIVQ